LLNTPSALTYILDGTEKRLRFSFGVEFSGGVDATKAGSARYSAELQRTGEPMRVLFERVLHPSESRDDRFRQFAQIALEAVRAGDRLVLRIDAIGAKPPDGNYITDFVLE